MGLRRVRHDLSTKQQQDRWEVTGVTSKLRAEGQAEVIQIVNNKKVTRSKDERSLGHSTEDELERGLCGGEEPAMRLLPRAEEPEGQTPLGW